MLLFLLVNSSLLFFSVSVMSSEHFEQSAVSNASTNNLALAVYEPPKIFKIFHADSRNFEFADHTLSISQDWKKNGVAAVVWDAALVLARYLETSVGLTRKKVIELGAGTGLVGIVAGLLGAQVSITDRKMALALARDNVERNSQNFNTSLIEVRELEWGQNVSSFDPPFDYVLGADIVYIEDTFKQLLKTIDELCDDKTVVLLSCKIRYERDNHFLGLLNKKFIVEEVFYDKELDIYIYKAIQRNN